MEAAFGARTLAAVTRNRSFCPWRCQHHCTSVISRAYQGHLYLPGSSHNKSFVLIPASPFLFSPYHPPLCPCPHLPFSFIGCCHSLTVTGAQSLSGSSLLVSCSTATPLLTVTGRRSVQHFISAAFFESFFLLCYSCPFGSCRCAWSAVSAHSIFIVCWL